MAITVRLSAVAGVESSSNQPVPSLTLPPCRSSLDGGWRFAAFFWAAIKSRLADRSICCPTHIANTSSRGARRQRRSLRHATARIHHRNVLLESRVSSARRWPGPDPTDVSPRKALSCRSDGFIGCHSLIILQCINDQTDMTSPVAAAAAAATIDRLMHVTGERR